MLSENYKAQIEDTDETRNLLDLLQVIEDKCLLFIKNTDFKDEYDIGVRGQINYSGRDFLVDEQIDIVDKLIVERLAKEFGFNKGASNPSQNDVKLPVVSINYSGSDDSSESEDSEEGY